MEDWTCACGSYRRQKAVKELGKKWKSGMRRSGLGLVSPNSV